MDRAHKTPRPQRSWRNTTITSATRGRIAPFLSFVVFLACFGFLEDRLAVSEAACMSWRTITVGPEKLSLTNVLPAV